VKPAFANTAKKGVLKNGGFFELEAKCCKTLSKTAQSILN